MQSEQNCHCLFIWHCGSTPKSDNGVPIVGLDGTISCPDDRFEALRQFCSPLHHMTPAGKISKDARIDALAARLGDCVLTQVSSCEMHFARTERHVRMECAGMLRLRIYQAGRSIGVLGEEGFDTSADRIQIIDFTRPYRSVITRSQAISVIIPHEAVGYDPAQHPAQFNFLLTSPWGRVLEEGTRALFARLPEIDLSEAKGIAENYCALVRGAIHRDACDDETLAEVGRVRHASIRRFIDENLDNPKLSTADVCRAFNASRAAIYREFEAFGGIARYIRQRRLEEAMRDLACTRASRGTIQRVSERWGFHDPSHFNRLFRAQFGFSPSEFTGIGDMETAMANTCLSDHDPGRVPDLSRWLK